MIAKFGSRLRQGLLGSAAILGLFAGPSAQAAPRWMEFLDRGAVAVPAGGGGNLVSWRLLATDPPNVEFDVYRNGKKINPRPLRAGTNIIDEGGTPQSAYVIRARAKGKDLESSPPVGVWADGYLSIPIQQPPGGSTPSGEGFLYTAHEASAGDLDGDGRYEIILKWDPASSDPAKGPVTFPSNARDNAFDGYTGNVYLDAYTQDGRRLWRIDMGRNIRAGAHYTQFQVFDYDGDGRAELAVRTSDGTIDGTGQVLGDPNADWREPGGETPSTDRTGGVTRSDGSMVAPLQGRIMKGPEFLTVFDGVTGKALASERYWPARDPRSDAPTAEQMKEVWGDGYANRSDRFLAGTAYLDGQRPSIIMARGYYARTTLAAWDWRDGKLTRRWVFDSSTAGNEAFGGQGNHQLSVADVDGDGRDEIVYGSMVVDDDGKGLWSSGLKHGDAMGVSDLDPSRPGLEKFGAHEEVKHNGGIGSAMLDARTGAVLWSTPADKDTGRAVTADIDPRFRGAEAWASNSDTLYTVQGKPIAGVKRPREQSFVVWWDGDDLRELFDKNRILKWDWMAGKSQTLLEATGALQTSGTKNIPVLSADLFGDWREEVVWHTPDEKFLRIYTTPHFTARRLVTLMHDAQYRVAIAWQNSAYNQPPYPGFFLGDGMKAPRAPDIVARKSAAGATATVPPALRPGAPSPELLASLTPASVPHPLASVLLSPDDAPPPTQSAYVMTAFSVASQSVMSVFDSADAAHFYQRKAPAYVPPKGDLIRDPSVMKHADGWYYVTYTTSWTGQTIGLARSRDLLEWSFVRNIEIPVAGSTSTWAPEWFVDGDGTVNILLTVGTGGQHGDHAPHRITATDASLEKWTAPRPLGIGPNYIDSFVVKVGPTYHNFIKNETTKYIEHATATSLDGPWTFVGTGDWAGWGRFLEGPALTRLPDGGWRIYFDEFMVKRYWYSDSHDGFVTWSPRAELPGSGTLRHFTVLNQRAGPTPAVVSAAEAKHP